MSGGPTAAALLELYERGAAAAPAARAALLCAVADPEASPASLALGDADRRLWALHRACHAGPIAATAACTACSALMEFDLPEGFGPPAAAPVAAGGIDHDGARYRVAMPRLVDLAEGRLPQALCPEAPWADPVFRAKAEAALEAADPGLRLQLALTCHACGTAQTLTFDIGGFLWERMAQSARRLIAETARLAAAFGWSEADILAMTPARRALYLAEVGP